MEYKKLRTKFKEVLNNISNYDIKAWLEFDKNRCAGRTPSQLIYDSLLEDKTLINRSINHELRFDTQKDRNTETYISFTCDLRTKDKSWSIHVFNYDDEVPLNYDATLEDIELTIKTLKLKEMENFTIVTNKTLCELIETNSRILRQVKMIREGDEVIERTQEHRLDVIERMANRIYDTIDQFPTKVQPKLKGSSQEIFGLAEHCLTTIKGNRTNTKYIFLGDDGRIIYSCKSEDKKFLKIRFLKAKKINYLILTLT